MVGPMDELQRAIAVSPGVTVSSVWRVPSGYDRERALVLAHGAGNDMHGEFLSFVHAALAERGTLTVKFNFPYTERGARAPDRPPVLIDAWRAVARSVREDAKVAPNRLVLGGKSMGGRIASMIAADGEECAGLVLLGYPLHPAGQPAKLRVDHLARIRVPMLFVQGTRDPLGEIALLEEELAGLEAPVTLHRIEEGDHSFAVPKRLGRAPQEIRDEIAGVVERWLAQLG
jgi:predicted alpha/beta-hydrolase family hydrolase